MILIYLNANDLMMLKVLDTQ